MAIKTTYAKNSIMACMAKWMKKAGRQAGAVATHNGVKRDTRLFEEYARQSFIDTLTLDLHGICCDIDVETGPRQLPSRHLRKRLI